MPAPRVVLYSPLQNVQTPPVRAGESARSGQPAERQTDKTAGAQPASATGTNIHQFPRVSCAYLTIMIYY